MRAWIAYDNHLRRAGVTVTASQEVTTWEAEHLSTLLLYEKWRTTDITAYVDVDFGDDRDVEFLAIIFPRIIDPSRRDDPQEVHPTDTVRHYLDAAGDSFGDGAIYDSGEIQSYAYPDRGYHVFILPEKYTGVRKWRIAFNMASRASVGHFDVSMLFASHIFRPAINYDYQDEFDLLDPSQSTRSITSGTRYSSRYERYLAFSSTFSSIDAEERPLWIAFNDFVGKTEPFFFGLADEEDMGRKTFFAVQERTSPLVEQNFIYSSRDLNLEEYR